MKLLTSIKKTFILATVILLFSNFTANRSFAETTTEPETQINLSISINEEPSEIVLDWECNTLDVDHYNVYSSTDSDFKPGDANILLSEVSANEFLDTNGIYANETKYYYVAAIDSDGNELAVSNIASNTADDYNDYGNEDIQWSRANPNAGAIWLLQDFISDYVIIHYTIDGQQYDEYMSHVSGGDWIMEFDDLGAVEDFSFTYHIFGFQYDSK
ncbi:hypothetical protein [Bacillus sp. SM2101]|uniref:hypothetical protein n=1 Tax=Bacillus sp. SM2101 TaxID=2805366 RepID=UPI001BDEAF98|nr:hypothetical protein [Bacillus sp. SM2101]